MMAYNPSLEVAVARDAAKKLGAKAEVGCVVIYMSRGNLGMASFGHNKALCAKMGELGDHLFEEARKYYEE